MKKVLFNVVAFLLIILTTTNCLSEQAVIIDPIDPIDTIDIADTLNLADVEPLVGIYIGSIAAFEGDNSIVQNSGYNLQVLKKDDGIIQIKGNGISYNFILLIDDNGVYKTHPSMTWVSNFSYDPVTKRLTFIISRPFVYINFDGILNG